MRRLALCSLVVFLSTAQVVLATEIFDIITTEPAVTVFPYGSAQRATVLPNGNGFGTYNVSGTTLTYAYLDHLQGAGHVNVFDPSAGTTPNGTAYLSASSIDNSISSILVWHSTDGFNWGTPSHVVDYSTSCPGCTFADAPRLSISRTSGRMWIGLVGVQRS